MFFIYHLALCFVSYKDKIMMGVFLLRVSERSVF